jgi:hypothetical protein
MRKFSFKLVTYELRVTHILDANNKQALKANLIFLATGDAVKGFTAFNEHNLCYQVHQEILCYQENKCDSALLLYAVEAMRDYLSHYFSQLEFKDIVPSIELLGEEV